MSDPVGPVVVAVDEQDDIAVDIDRWRCLVAGALRAEGLDRGELNLLFVTSDEMAALNTTHMGKSGPTDVLSFPLDPRGDPVLGDPLPGDPFPGNPLPGDPLLGDIVVCPARADEQAEAHRGARGHDGSVDDEIALLVVHGVLHIAGWDHADDEQADAMEAREDELLVRLHRSDR